MNPTEARLARLRGRVLPRNHNARTISALATNPGCARRALMDAAGADKERLAAQAGYPVPFGQSRFAITRGNAFEAQLKENGAAQLLTVLRGRLGLPPDQAHYTDLNEVGGNDDNQLRHIYTRQRLTAADGHEGTMFDHPLLRLNVGGRHAYLEPDLIAFQLHGKFHVVEIKSFAVIDGQADAAKVAAAAIQSAVYVLALRDLLGDDGRVHDETILVCPENFSNQPTATSIDVRKQLTVLTRQLTRIARIEDLLAACPGDLTFDLDPDENRVPRRPPAAIVDEACQMRSDLLLRVANLFQKALFVGDPGQLDPFSTVQTERWLGLSWDPMSSAVAVLLNHNPQVPVHTLPVPWRLPASAAPVVSEAFYPFGGFRSATVEGERRLGWNTRPFGMNALDLALETAAESGWALYELPHRHTLRTDADAVRACAGLAARLLQRGAETISERSAAPLPVTPSRVAVADTANRLQGREFDVVIVLHPLSGRRDATAFHLEAGRLCVLTSRHRHACVVVARAGIPELLDAHPSVEPVHLNVPVKFPDGWEAHQALMAHLSKHLVRAP